MELRTILRNYVVLMPKLAKSNEIKTEGKFNYFEKNLG